MSKLTEDPRLDPRIKAVFTEGPPPRPKDAKSREEMIERANTEEAIAQRELGKEFTDRCDTEEVAPSAGLNISTKKITSQPDGNTINIQFIRPDNSEKVPCVCHIHGGGMQAGS